MLKSRVELEEYLYGNTMRFLENKDKAQELREYLYNQYDISMGRTMDFLSHRAPLANDSDFLLYCFTDGIDKITKGNKVQEYFTPIEINHYSKSKVFKEDELKFPLRIPCFQVADDQWIGAADIGFFIKLRNNQKIIYNENTQRALRRVVRGDTEIFTISVNKAVVNSIKESMNKGSYIPNTITLNIPEDSISEFYYNKEESCLVFNSLDKFDITDGYHRYIAMCGLKDTDNNFNYPMEIRITNFAENKAKHFIFQEDLKTKMKRVDSHALSIDNKATTVVERLNLDSLCNYQGEINRNKYLINSSELSSIIEYFYFKTYKRQTNNAAIAEIVKEVRDILNTFSNYYPEYLSHRFSYRELCLLMWTFLETEKSHEEKCKLTRALFGSKNLDHRKFYNKIPRKSLFSHIQSVAEEV